jgi:plasmid stabilization system protein ParE
MKVRILDAAQTDLKSGFRFYESQDQGIGSYFLDSLFADIDSLMFYAGIHQIVNGGFYRMLAKRFPFAVYYRVEQETVLVYAVLDCRGKPAWNRKSLREALGKKT